MKDFYSSTKSDQNILYGVILLDPNCQVIPQHSPRKKYHYFQLFAPKSVSKNGNYTNRTYCFRTKDSGKKIRWKSCLKQAIINTH